METRPRSVEVYGAPDGTFPFDRWLARLRDGKCKGAIETRIARLRLGLIGDHQSVGDGIIELKIDCGPGYRVYCVDDGSTVLILWAGSKRTQAADIIKAREYWREYKGK